MGLRIDRRSKSGLHRERFVLFTDFEINGDPRALYVSVKIHEKDLSWLKSWKHECIVLWLIFAI